MRSFWSRIAKTGVPEVCSTAVSKKELCNTVPVSRLSENDLCCKHDPQFFKFKTTADISVNSSTVGQDQALNAIEFGIRMKSKGFNIFVAGAAGTGKNFAILEKVNGFANSEPVPEDICSLYNFKLPQSPLVLFFPAGFAKEFKMDMENSIKSILKRIKEAFCSEKYEMQCHLIEKAFQNEKKRLDKQLKSYSEIKECELKYNRKIGTSQTLFDEESLSNEELVYTNKVQKSDNADNQQVNDPIFDISRTIRLKQRQTDVEICETDRRTISDILGKTLSGVDDKYRHINGILQYLDDLKEDFIKDIEVYKPYNFPEESNVVDLTEIPEKYLVNILVDNSETKGAPVIVENNPSFSNLFGSIDYRMQNSSVTVDHLSLLAGSVHRARGGYLIIEIEEILGDLRAWNALKKLLRHGECRIENASEHMGLIPVINLRPQPIPVDLKIILTGDPMFYQTLYSQDDEFERLFKVKADFVEQIEKSDSVLFGLSSFIARVCEEEKLKHCDRTAVSRVIEFSSRLADHKERISAKFVKIADLLREANYYATQKCSSYISEEHINFACEEQKKRNRIHEERIFALIEDGSVYIDVSGSEVGQINGVSIINTGDYTFGVPSRITVKTFTGSGNIINIEREAEMSGKIHAKGILILSGYLGQTYAQDKPLALSASICFEQHYEEIDGDSASSAELYCLLSSLSGVPLRQDIAVTGSVDQRGRIQPVGGINCKIEGFFKTCFIKGLTGTQGMIIPSANVKNLMLGDEIIEAVKKGQFHIYPVSSIEEGLQILTGKDPGAVLEDGSFEPDTIHFLVNQKLRDYASVIASYGK